MNNKHPSSSTHPLLIVIVWFGTAFMAFSGLCFLPGLCLLYQHSPGLGIFFVLATLTCLAGFASEKRRNKKASEVLQQRIVEGEARRLKRISRIGK